MPLEGEPFASMWTDPLSLQVSLSALYPIGHLFNCNLMHIASTFGFFHADPGNQSWAKIGAHGEHHEYVLSLTGAQGQG